MRDPLRWIGVWHEGAADHYPRPEDYVDPDWDEWERHAVADHLRYGIVVGMPMDGRAPCLLCGEPMYRGAITTDGTYVWRGALVHYVDDHCVRLPQEFVTFVLDFIDQVDALADDGGRWWQSSANREGDPAQS